MPESGQGARSRHRSASGGLQPTTVLTRPSCVSLRFSSRRSSANASPMSFRASGTPRGTSATHVKNCPRGATAWQRTVSCWQQNRHAGVNHRRRQCGICAACLLRRMSVHAASLTEPNDTYVWEDLSAPTFEAGASPDFDRAKMTSKMREYAIAEHAASRPSGRTCGIHLRRPIGAWFAYLPSHACLRTTCQRKSAEEAR